jgi:hypothetical protein
MKSSRAIMAAVIFTLALAIGFLAGSAFYGGGVSPENGEALSADGIPFEYFYRGFTPVVSDSSAVYGASEFEAVLGISVLLTEEDWLDFADRFCPFALHYSLPDFSRECLVAASGMYGSTASANSSFAIATISCADGALVMTADGAHPAERIHALTLNNIGHWFVNVVKIKKSDLPPEVKDVYVSGAG